MHLTSISQPPSARVSPITRDLIDSPHFTSLIPGSLDRRYISRSQNNTPLPGSLPGSLPGYYYDNGFLDPLTDPNLHGINATSAYGHGFPYYDDPGSPIMDARGLPAGTGGIIHGPRARSARAGMIPGVRPGGYVDPRTGIMTGDPMMMDRTGAMTAGADPYLMGRDPLMRDPRDRSLDRLDMSGTRIPRRDRSLERSVYLRDEHGYRDPLMMDDPYRDQTLRATMSHSLPVGDPRHAYSRDSFIMELQARLNEIQTQYAHVKRELDATTQKLGSSMHSIKTFWSPELKKERALRKEEAAKYALLSDQLKILRSENQVRNLTLRQSVI